MTISQAKFSLRQQAQKAVCSLTPDEILQAGLLTAQHIDQWLTTLLLSSQRSTQQSAALFVSLKDEIATAPLANLLTKHGFTLSWPHIVSNTIMKFVPPSKLAIIFVPGLAFDRLGHRLGRGKGYYDRYLTGLDHKASHPILMGLCLDEQLFECVPIEEHDVVMDFICTPKLGVLTTCE